MPNRYAQPDPDAWRRARYGLTYPLGVTVNVKPLPVSDRGYKIKRREDVTADEEFRYRDDRDFETAKDDPIKALSRRLVEVRPAPPKTEYVPWHEAAGRYTPEGRYISEARRDARGTVTLVIGGFNEAYLLDTIKVKK